MENKSKNVFFRKDFDTPSENYEEVINKYAKRLSFIDQVRVNPDSDRKLLIDLKNDYESGLIDKNSFTKDQISKIEELYINQITKLNSSDIQKDDIMNIKRQNNLNG